MTVTVRSIQDPVAFARFTWSDDMQDCDVTALGIEDDALDAIIEAKAHEGADLAGYTITID